MSIYCHCNDCLAWGKTQKKLDECESPVTLDQMMEEQCLEQLNHVIEVPGCPEYRYTGDGEACGAALSRGEKVCDRCARLTQQDEIADIEFCRAYESRQVDIVDVLVVAAENPQQGDTDGDVDDIQKRAYRLPKWKL